MTFEAGDPFCMIVPQRRGELESFRPRLRDIHSEPELKELNHQWSASRHQVGVRKFLAEHVPGLEDEKYAWEGQYFRGLLPDGSTSAVHQKHLQVAAFESIKQEP